MKRATGSVNSVTEVCDPLLAPFSINILEAFYAHFVAVSVPVFRVSFFQLERGLQATGSHCISSAISVAWEHAWCHAKMVSRRYSIQPDGEQLLSRRMETRAC